MSNNPPPWQDISTLCKNLCICVTTVEAWAAQGIIPPARLRGGKRMWKWAEVDAWLTNGKPGEGPDSEAERIRNGTRQETQDRSRH